MSNISTQMVIESLRTTKQMQPEYYESILNHRIHGNNCYNQYFSIAELETAIMNSDWIETSNSVMIPESRIFKANLPAHINLVRIEDTPVDTIFTAYDPDGTKKVFMVLSENIERISHLINETYVAIRSVEGRLILSQITPSKPIALSIVRTATVKHGDLMSRNSAHYLGWKYAQII